MLEVSCPPLSHQYWEVSLKIRFTDKATINLLKKYTAVIKIIMPIKETLDHLYTPTPQAMWSALEEIATPWPLEFLRF